jgi:hypothetical protein
LDTLAGAAPSQFAPFLSAFSKLAYLYDATFGSFAISQLTKANFWFSVCTVCGG